MNTNQQVESHRLLWLSGVFPEETLLKNPAVSPASNRWHSGIIASLESRGWRVDTLSYIPERQWPYGSCWVSGKTGSIKRNEQKRLVSYINAPFIRPFSLTMAMVIAYLMRRRRGVSDTAVVTYNAHVWTATMGAIASKVFRTPWIHIVADVPAIGSTGHIFHQYIASLASGLVFLSWACYSQGSTVPSMHLDGGVASLPPEMEVTDCSTAAKIILYAGTLTKYGGMSMLIESMNHLNGNDIELWICGRGNEDSILKASNRDSRIKFCGLVPEKELVRILRRANVFVNPRPSNIPGNEHNFPSKVLEYMTYGKPVVSTITPGMAPEYRDVLLVPEREDPEALAICLREALSWGDDKRREYSTKVTHFLNSEKLWSIQAERLSNFIYSIAARKDNI